MGWEGGVAGSLSQRVIKGDLTFKFSWSPFSFYVTVEPVPAPGTSMVCVDRNTEAARGAVWGAGVGVWGCF